MEFGEALSGGLPSPRDDEPDGLRQDIIDELADHLALGVQREQLRANDAAAARARAVERFGDPAAVACRLWTDAMKGKFMAQRAVIVTCVLVAAASLSSVAILWRELVQARRMAVDQAAAQAAEARVREQEMLRQLQEMSQSIVRLRSPNGSEVRIKLADDSADARPVAGALILLTCVSEDPQKRVNRTSDALGSASFGALAPGDYQIQITRDWANGSMSTTGKLEVQPGIDVNKLIVCPVVPPQRASVLVRWKWPADLQKEALVVSASYGFRGVESASGLRWTIDRKFVDPRRRSQESGDSSEFDWSPLSYSILCGPSNNVARFTLTRGLLLWNIESEDERTGPLGFGRALKLLDEPVKPDRRVFADALEEDIEHHVGDAGLLDVEAGEYELLELLVLRRVQTPDIERGVRRFNLLAAIRSREYARFVCTDSKPPTTDDLKAASLKLMPRQYSSFDLTGVLAPTLGLPREFWVGAKHHVEPNSGQPREWTVPLPDELIHAVREAIKAEKAPNAGTDPTKNDGL